MSASEEPPSIAEIRRYARSALAAAEALDTIPVPLDNVVSVVGIPREDLFDFGNQAVPPRILAIARRLTGRVLGAMALEEKTHYVSSSMAAPRRRFTIGLEVGHNALPWHKDAYYVDDQTRLATATREILEQEANALAAQLMFGVDRFADEADSCVPKSGSATRARKPLPDLGTRRSTSLRNDKSPIRCAPRPRAIPILQRHKPRRPTRPVRHLTQLRNALRQGR